MTNTHTSLNKKFDCLNKEYLKLDKSLDSATTEDYQIMVSQQMEDIQVKMSAVSSKLEELGYLD